MSVNIVKLIQEYADLPKPEETPSLEYNVMSSTLMQIFYDRCEQIHFAPCKDTPIFSKEICICKQHREECGVIEKSKRNALIDRLFKFNIQISSSYFRQDRSKIPGKSAIVKDLNQDPDPEFISSITKWLKRLANSPTGYTLLDFIANSSASIEIAKGESDFAYQEEDGSIKVLLDSLPSITSAIGQSNGRMHFFYVPRYITLAHELIHVRHMIQNIFKDTIDKTRYDDLYFRNAEEMLTILGYENFDSARIKDNINENAISRDFGLPERVSHREKCIGAPVEALLGVDGEMRTIIERGKHHKRNYLKDAIRGACSGQKSRRGNHFEVIALLVKARCSEEEIEESVEWLLSSAYNVSPRFKLKILKMLGPHVFHDAIRSGSYIDFQQWIQIVLAVEGVRGVRALLHSTNDQGLTPSK